MNTYKQLRKFDDDHCHCSTFTVLITATDGSSIEFEVDCINVDLIEDDQLLIHMNATNREA